MEVRLQKMKFLIVDEVEAVGAVLLHDLEDTIRRHSRRETKYIAADPAERKATHECVKALRHFLGATQCLFGYTDGSPELKNAMDEVSIPHDKATPHEPQTNGRAERAVRRVKEGTNCALVQSGLSDAFWGEAMRC